MPQKEEAKGTARLVLKCALFAMAVTAALLALASLLVTGGLLAPEHSIAAVLLAEVIGAFAGGRIASRKAASRKLATAALTGLCLFLILLVAGLLFAFPPARHGLLILPAAVLPALLGGLQRPKRASLRR
ncbi:MAG: TIGR04086 family membrane protein [Oscillospiraceae bacterium]|jgi:putative membrane protein (TIGR04086 family)|nr:TIGR04086 family membrane protein [Oscillospiraceae bacterium]